MAKTTSKKYWHEVAIPFQDLNKFKGVSVGYDKRKNSPGYFVFTHRAKSKSYSSIARIPESVIKRIAATG